MSEEGNGWLSDAISDGVETVRKVTSFLGIERERFVCPKCNEACNESRTHDVQRMAFDGGSSPSWFCESCQTHYVREVDDESHTMDLYGRGL